MNGIEQTLHNEALAYVEKGVFKKCDFESNNWKIRLVVGFVLGYPIEALIDENYLVAERAMCQMKMFDNLNLKET